MSEKSSNFAVAKLKTKETSTMIGFTKRIESFLEDMYRDLDYGTIYYVAGTATQKLNDYVKNHAEEIESQLNSDERNWITCKIVYLDSENTFFMASKKAVLYSAMLPFEDSLFSVYSFLVATLNLQEPAPAKKVLAEYFITLQQMFDEILDTRKFQEYHLRQTILSPFDDNVLFSISRDSEIDDSHVRYCLVDEPFPYEKLSRLVITPHTFHVLLPDYNREIMFTAQVKALYILFLHHPEGIRMKDIADYKEEYKQLYFRLTNRSDIDKLRDSIDKLLDVCNPNALNVKKSQCNSAIYDAIPKDEIYQYYKIEVNRGLPHKINLDRSLVSMPDILKAK